MIEEFFWEFSKNSEQNFGENKADGYNLKSFNFFSDLWDEAEGYVIKAKDIFEVMFGKDYPLLTQKWKSIQVQIDQHKTSSWKK